jgi:hypothetical protein
VSLVTKCVTGEFLQLTFNDVGRGGGERGWGQKCFLSKAFEGKKGKRSAKFFLF